MTCLCSKEIAGGKHAHLCPEHGAKQAYCDDETGKVRNKPKSPNWHSILFHAKDYNALAAALVESHRAHMEAVGNAQAAYTALEKERNELREEDDFNNALTGRLGKILNDTANVLKGPPDELALHSTHDLAAVATKLVAELASLRAANAELRKHVRHDHETCDLITAYELRSAWDRQMNKPRCTCGAAAALKADAGGEG